MSKLEDHIEDYNNQIYKIMSVFPEYFIDKTTSQAKIDMIDITIEQLKTFAKIVYNDGYYDGKSSKN